MDALHGSSSSTSNVGAQQPRADSDFNPLKNLASVIADLVLTLFRNLLNFISSDSNTKEYDVQMCVRLQREIETWKGRYQSENSEKRSLNKENNELRTLLNFAESKMYDLDTERLFRNPKVIDAH